MALHAHFMQTCRVLRYCRYCARMNETMTVIIHEIMRLIISIKMGVLMNQMGF
jgi:hypothetical protein